MGGRGGFHGAVLHWPGPAGFAADPTSPTLLTGLLRGGYASLVRALLLQVLGAGSSDDSTVGQGATPCARSANPCRARGSSRGADSCADATGRLAAFCARALGACRTRLTGEGGACKRGETNRNRGDVCSCLPYQGQIFDFIPLVVPQGAKGDIVHPRQALGQ